jgi:hypothetical protein
VGAGLPVDREVGSWEEDEEEGGYVLEEAAVVALHVEDQPGAVVRMATISTTPKPTSPDLLRQGLVAHLHHAQTRDGNSGGMLMQKEERGLCMEVA